MRYYIIRRDENLMPGHVWVHGEHVGIDKPEALLNGDMVVPCDIEATGEASSLTLPELRAIAAWEQRDDSIAERYQTRWNALVTVTSACQEAEQLLDKGQFSEAASLLDDAVRTCERTPGVAGDEHLIEVR
jgi:hypothetical protein